MGVDIVKKALSIFKCEFTNLKRSKILWVTLALYLIGYQQLFSALFNHFEFKGGLVSLIKLSWLPINFIMIPLLIISCNIGASRNEIFNVMDVTPVEKIFGNAMSVLMIDLIFSLINFGIVVVIAVISKVSLSYFWYLFLGHSINTILTLIVVTFIGLLIGEVFGDILLGILSYFVIGVFFIIACSFYKTEASILTLYDIPCFGSNLFLFKYDEFFTYHIVFWSSIIIVAIMLIYITECKFTFHRISILPGVIMVPFLIVAVVSFISGQSFKPTHYEFNKEENITCDYIRVPYYSFFGKENGKYHVANYDMDIQLARNFENKCNMDIVITEDGVKELTFGLYGKLNIKEILIEGEKASYTRDNRKFTVRLPKESNKGEKIKLLVNYEGRINTVWSQGTTLFFSENNSSFLADVFEWYPKVNDDSEKNYSIKVTHGSKLYSNLQTSYEDGLYYLSGSDKEIFLLSGNISERQYKGLSFIGNEEYFKTEKQCENAISLAKACNWGENRGFNRIIYGPFVPSTNKNVQKTYKGVYLHLGADTSEIISTK